MTTNISIKRELNRNGDKRGMHPNSQKNLKSALGRPKNSDCLTALLKEELGRKIDGSEITNKQMIASMLVSIAVKGNLKAIEMVLNYIEGRPKEHVDITSMDESLAPKPTFVLQMPDGITVNATQLLRLNGCTSSN